MIDILLELGEEILPIIFVIGAIVFRVISRAVKKNQEGAQPRQEENSSADTSKNDTVLSQFEEFLSRVTGEVNKPDSTYSWNEAYMFEEDASTEGMSSFDDEGCIGGSIEHTAHEGPSVSIRESVMEPFACEGARGSLDYIPTTHYEPVAFGGTPAEAHQTIEHRPLTSAQLRTAVIMAEVLNRPVAMRKAYGKSLSRGGI